MSFAGRKASAFTLLLPLLLGLLVAVSSAQTVPKVFQVNADLTPGSETITERFGSVTLNLTVTVTVANPNQLADQATIVVNITRDTHNPPPNGWAIVGPTETSFTFGPGQPRSKSQTVEIRLTAEDPDERPLNLQYTVRARPTFPASPLDPLLGTALGNQESQDTATATVRRNLEPAEALTSFVFQNAWLLAIAAAAILIIVGVLLRGRRRSGVALATDAPLQEIVPGRGASFPIVVTNLASDKETVVLGTSDVPAGWSAILPVERLELRANESTTIWLTLKSPSNARPGENIQVAFIATGTDGTATEVRLEASVVERYGEAGATEEESPQPAKAASRAR